MICWNWLYDRKQNQNYLGKSGKLKETKATKPENEQKIFLIVFCLWWHWNRIFRCQIVHFLCFSKLECGRNHLDFVALRKVVRSWKAYLLHQDSSNLFPEPICLMIIFVFDQRLWIVCYNFQCKRKQRSSLICQILKRFL